MNGKDSQLNELTKIFVYGTLKPGESNYQRYCAKQLLQATRAIAFGELFALPFGYPAITPGNLPVHGFLLSFPDSSILSQLDWLEDYDCQRPETENEYNRRVIETYDVHHASLGLAWVYEMTLKQVYACGGIFLPDGWWSGGGLSPHHSIKSK